MKRKKTRIIRAGDDKISPLPTSSRDPGQTEMSGDIPYSDETEIAAGLSNRYGRMAARAGCHGKNRADNRHYRTGGNPALPPEGATIIFFDFEARLFALDSAGSPVASAHRRGAMIGGGSRERSNSWLAREALRPRLRPGRHSVNLGFCWHPVCARVGRRQVYRSTISKRDVLRGSALFARLSDEETDAILAHARIARYATGDVIVSKGDPGDSMMAVLQGRVSISTTSEDGRQVVLSALGIGDVFGEIALLDGKERTADVTALTDCEVLIVPRRSLWSLLERRPELCIALMLVLCERLRHTTEQVEDLAFLHLESRMAKALLRLLDESDAGQTRAEPAAIRISQRALGELVGGSRESVNKHLNAWKELGIVAIEKGGIVIRDVAALADYAH